MPLKILKGFARIICLALSLASIGVFHNRHSDPARYLKSYRRPPPQQSLEAF